MESQELENLINIKITELFFFPPLEKAIIRCGVCCVQTEPFDIEIGNIFIYVNMENNKIQIKPPHNNYLLSENEKITSPTVRFDDKTIWRLIRKKAIIEIKNLIKNGIDKIPIIIPKKNYSR